MKVYISADIEGVTGAAHWNETETGKEGYARLRDRMAREVATVASAALASGATEVWVKDAHDTGRNLVPEDLPAGCRLIRGWSGDPLMMVQELDSSFATLLLVGWHSPAASGLSPLAHSMSTRLTRLELNGAPASELRLHGLAAAELGVPLGLVAGDAGICAEAQAFVPGLRTVATQAGVGESIVCADAAGVLEQLGLRTREILANRTSWALPVLEQEWTLELEYRVAGEAFRNAHFPGMELTGPHQLRLRCDTVREVLRALLFVG